MKATPYLPACVTKIKNYEVVNGSYCGFKSLPLCLNKSTPDMRYEATGKIIRIFDIEKKTDTFQTREFVIEVPDGNYSQMVKFQLTQDKCELVNNFSEGDLVKVSFSLRGREWQGKYFTNLDAWRVEAASESGNQGNNFGDVVFPEAHHEPANAPDEKDDDLPF